LTIQWFDWGIDYGRGDLEKHAERLLKGKDVVDVRITPYSNNKSLWRLEFAKELTYEQEMEVKIRQTTIAAFYDHPTMIGETSNDN